MTVGELAEQLNELYTKAEKNGIDIENFEFHGYPGIRGFETVLYVDSDRRIVELI